MQMVLRSIGESPASSVLVNIVAMWNKQTNKQTNKRRNKNNSCCSHSQHNHSCECGCSPCVWAVDVINYAVDLFCFFCFFLSFECYLIIQWNPSQVIGFICGRVYVFYVWLNCVAWRRKIDLLPINDDGSCMGKMPPKRQMWAWSSREWGKGRREMSPPPPGFSYFRGSSRWILVWLILHSGQSDEANVWRRIEDSQRASFTITTREVTNSTLRRFRHSDVFESQKRCHLETGRDHHRKMVRLDFGNDSLECW